MENENGSHAEQLNANANRAELDRLFDEVFANIG